jgi:hypothetical protein
MWDRRPKMWLVHSGAMRFVMEIDLSPMADGREADELARILRYWAGAMKQVALKPGVSQAVHDSDYTEVGSWAIEE